MKPLKLAIIGVVCCALLPIIFFSVVALIGGQVVSELATPEDNSGTVGLKVGYRAPEFTVRTIEGREVRSEEYRGKVLVITSSAAWCSTCIYEAEQFAPVYEKYKDEDVEFLTIDIDPRDAIEFIYAFRVNTGTPWTYTDATGGQDLIQDYKLNRFEITYVIDRDGIIRFKDNSITSTDVLEAAIARVL